jgi:uncharacterized membrane protein YhfC
MLNVSFAVAVLVEVLAPLALGFWIYRHYGARWGLFFVGVLTFIGSQLVHIPLVIGWQYLSTNVLMLGEAAKPLVQAVTLGLLAGLCEEPARLVGLLILRRLGRRWNSRDSALMLGTGHGGVESILVGVSVAVNYVVMMVARDTPSTIPGLEPAMIEEFWGMAWHLPLAGAVERLIAILLHVTLSVMVWRALSRRQWGWLWLAILWHALVDMGAVLLLGQGWSAWAIEGALLVTVLVNVAILVYLWRSSPETELPDPAEPDTPAPAV